MKKIPFNVSARTARLIGRENVSSAEGALIELVKNSYDADATYCIVFFDDKYANIPAICDNDTVLKLVEITGQPKLANCFQPQLFDQNLLFSEAQYHEEFSKQERRNIAAALLRTVTLYVLDDGDGMKEETIEQSWMTIGTDNKYIDFLSDKTGRVRSGAKGIGRFALDRLGERCDLITKTESAEKPINWSVNWNDFDKPGTTIDQVNASLDDSSTTLRVNLEQIIKEKFSLFEDNEFKKGTHIKVSRVRDSWSRENIESIYVELESLVPPSEAGGFSIYMFSAAQCDDYGKVLPAVCEDYDYKLHAQIDSAGQVIFEINRHEADPERITDDLMQRPYFKEHNIFPEHLKNETQTYRKKLNELIPGITEANNELLASMGAFDFTFYFLKRQSEKSDITTFLHRAYDPSSRKKWLEHNSGIRIYRDNFRVRPYGEIGKSSWDWLGLASRHADDPSALRSGRWRVSPNNLSGVIHISRVNNLGLEDKSSREGMRENDTFVLFKNIIEAIIKEFELDRSGIYGEIYKYSQASKEIPTDDDLNSSQETDAENLAQRIFQEIKSRPEATKDDSEKLAVALLKAKARSREADDRLEEMKRENSLLRVFASSGLTIAAFTHELDGLNAKLGGRFDQLTDLVNAYVVMDPAERLHIQSYKDPFKRIEMLRRDDERIKNWIKYSLRTIRKDKRNRKKINLHNYFQILRDEWNATLIERQVSFSITIDSPESFIIAYEIDLDCIFNNLIINSTEAFKRTGFSGEREIEIDVKRTEDAIDFHYKDSGPGLSSDIANPNDIFKATYSTKVNKHGVQIGTGLGMWLVKKTVEEYAGLVEIKKHSGFSIRIRMKK